METTKCNLCGSSHSINAYELEDLLLDRLETRATIVQCLECGLLYQNPRPSIEEMQAYYPDDYQPYQVDIHNQSYILRKAIEFGYQSRIHNITDFKSQGKLLDIGCAGGEFLEHFRKIPGWIVSGVELNPFASQVARDKGLEIFTGTLEQAHFPDHSFDVITMWDVLEHLHDPKGTLQEIRRILKPGGLVALRLPNGDSWDRLLFGRFWSGFDAPRHLYIFTHATMKEILKKTGFSLLRMSTRQGSYLGFTLSIDFWMTARNYSITKRSTILKLLRSPLARLFTAPVFYIYSLTQHATQLLVVAESPVDQ